VAVTILQFTSRSTYLYSLRRPYPQHFEWPQRWHKQQRNAFTDVLKPTEYKLSAGMVSHFPRNHCLVGARYCRWVADGNSNGLGERCIQEQVEVDVHPMNPTIGPQDPCTNEKVGLRFGYGAEV